MIPLLRSYLVTLSGVALALLSVLACGAPPEDAGRPVVEQAPPEDATLPDPAPKHTAPSSTPPAWRFAPPDGVLSDKVDGLQFLLQCDDGEPDVYYRLKVGNWGGRQSARPVGSVYVTLLFDSQIPPPDYTRYLRRLYSSFDSTNPSPLMSFAPGHDADFQHAEYEQLLPGAPTEFSLADEDESDYFVRRIRDSRTMRAIFLDETDIPSGGLSVADRLATLPVVFDATFDLRRRFRRLLPDILRQEAESRRGTAAEGGCTKSRGMRTVDDSTGRTTGAVRAG